MWRLFSIFFLLLTFPINGQQKIAALSGSLKESSALVLKGDFLLTINDSGNKPVIYVFDKAGEISHQCYISNAINRDWEALVYDGKEHLFIGDIGNNQNNRKNLRVYKVHVDSVLNKNTASAITIKFHYDDQELFPPQKSERYFDAEAMVYNNDSLFIFTKNRTEPFDGISKVYALALQPTTGQAACHLYNIQLKPTHWMEESITDAHLCSEDLFILTYGKIYWYKWSHQDFKLTKTYLFDSYTQKEGLTMDKAFFYLTDEDESIITGGNYLYKLKR